MACGSRSVYLVTYSQADREKVESKQEFSEIVVQEFKDCEVIQWVCSEEKHKEEGFHYHLALKLDRVKRWKSVRERIQQKYGISVHFSDHHSNYCSAYKYVIKEGDFLESGGHPEYTGSPKTSTASRKRRREPKQSDETSSSGRPNSVMCVYDMIVKSNIRNDLELCAQAQRELRDGKTDLAQFILRRSEKNRCELIKTAWKLKSAEEIVERQERNRIEIFEDCGKLECECLNHEQWLASAVEVLNRNNINIGDFCTVVYTALLKGRGKQQNVAVVGPSNCGKTFLLTPLTQIFQAFVNPASGTFSWVGAESAEIVFLNDFRWSDKIIPWADLLNLLEGAPIHISAPKTHFAEDILWSKDTPIFSTSASIIRKYEGGRVDEIESEMMANRWAVFNLKNPFDKSEIKPIKACKRCFYELISSFRVR